MSSGPAIQEGIVQSMESGSRRESERAGIVHNGVNGEEAD